MCAGNSTELYRAYTVVQRLVESWLADADVERVIEEIAQISARRDAGTCAGKVVAPEQADILGAPVGQGLFVEGDSTG